MPAEHRVAGLDKRTFVPAFFVLAVVALCLVVFPRVDDAIAWDDPVRAGDRMALTDSLVFTPATGWDIEQGLRVGDGATSSSSGNAFLVHNGVSVDVSTADFDGTPAELLSQVEKRDSATTDTTFRADGQPATVTTSTGETGVVQPFHSLEADELIATFVVDGTGVEFSASGPPAQMAAARDAVAAMIASIRSEESDS